MGNIMKASDTFTDSIRVAQSVGISSAIRDNGFPVVSVDHSPLVNLAIKNLKTERGSFRWKRGPIKLVKHPWVSIR